LYEIQRDTEKKGDKNSDGDNTSRKPDQIGVVEQADENPCDALIA